MVVVSEEVKENTISTHGCVTVGTWEEGKEARRKKKKEKKKTFWPSHLVFENFHFVHSFFISHSPSPILQHIPSPCLFSLLILVPRPKSTVLTKPSLSRKHEYHHRHTRTHFLGKWPSSSRDRQTTSCAYRWCWSGWTFPRYPPREGRHPLRNLWAFCRAKAFG